MIQPITSLPKFFKNQRAGGGVLDCILRGHERETTIVVHSCGARTGGCKFDGDAARCTAACPGDSDEERIPLTVRRTGCWESLVPIASLENLNNLPMKIENILN